MGIAGGLVARRDEGHPTGTFIKPAPRTGILVRTGPFMHSSRPLRGGSPGHSVGGRSLDLVALPVLLSAGNAGLRAPGRAAIPIAAPIVFKT